MALLNNLGNGLVSLNGTTGQNKKGVTAGAATSSGSTGKSSGGKITIRSGSTGSGQSGSKSTSGNKQNNFITYNSPVANSMRIQQERAIVQGLVQQHPEIVQRAYDNVQNSYLTAFNVMAGQERTQQHRMIANNALQNLNKSLQALGTIQSAFRMYGNDDQVSQVMTAATDGYKAMQKDFEERYGKWEMPQAEDNGERGFGAWAKNAGEAAAKSTAGGYLGAAVTAGADVQRRVNWDDTPVDVRITTPEGRAEAERQWYTEQYNNLLKEREQYIQDSQTYGLPVDQAVLADYDARLARLDPAHVADVPAVNEETGRPTGLSIRLHPEGRETTDRQWYTDQYNNLLRERDQYIQDSRTYGLPVDEAVLADYDARLARLNPDNVGTAEEMRAGAEAALQATRDRVDRLAEESAAAQQQAKDIANRNAILSRPMATGRLGSWLGVDQMTIGDMLTDASVAGAEMMGDVAIGTVTGGGSMLPMVVRTFGAGASEAARNGADVNEQIFQGVKQAAIEWVTEKLFAGNPLYDQGGGWVTDAVYNTLYKRFGAETMDRLFSTAAARIAKIPMAMMSEGVEEVLSDLFNPLVDWTANQIDGGNRDTSLASRGDFVKDFLVGAALGGFGNVTEAASGAVQNAAATMQAGRTIRQNNAQEALQDVAGYVGQDVDLGRGRDVDLGRAFNQVQEAYTSQAVENRLADLGAQTSPALTEAVKRMAEDKALSREQQAAYFGSFQQARQVMLEYKAAMSGDVNADNVWAYDSLIRAEDLAPAETGERTAPAEEAAPEAAPETAQPAEAPTEREVHSAPENVTNEQENVANAPESVANAPESAADAVRAEVAALAQEENVETAFGEKYRELTTRQREATDPAEREALADALKNMNDIADAVNQAPAESRADVLRGIIKSVYGGMNNGAEGNRVSDAEGRRDDGARAGVEAGTVRSVENGNDGRGAQDRGWNRVVPAADQSAQSIGIRNGTDAVRNSVLPEAEWTDDLKDLAGRIRERGMDPVFVRGTMEIRDPATDQLHHVSGCWESERVFIQTDNRLYSAQQIADHEIMHDRLASDPAMLEEIIARMDLTDEQIERIAAQYAKTFGFVYGEATESMTADEQQALYRMYMEEFVCDAAAGLNRVGVRGTVTPSRFTDAANDVIREREGMGYGAGGMPGSRYSFARENDSAVTDQAEAMERDGADRDTIWRDMGIIRDASGIWVTELDDSKMQVFPKGDALLADDAQYQHYMDLAREGNFWAPDYAALHEKYGNRERGKKTLEQFVRHDALFERYPELRNTEFIFRELPAGEHGYYASGMNAIVLDESLRKEINAGQLSSTAIHEIQHAMQELDGRAGGSNQFYWETRNQERFGEQNDRKAELRENIQETRRQLDDLYQKIGYEDYVFQVYERAEDGEITEEDADRIIDDWVKERSPAAAALQRALNDMYIRLRDDFGEIPSAADQYLNTAGEIEARETARRRGMSAEERRAETPDLGWDRAVFANDTETSLDEETEKMIDNAVEEIISAKGQLGDKYNQRRISSYPSDVQAMVKKASGGKIDVSGKYIALNGYEVWHEYLRHSQEYNLAAETSRDQIAFTREEFKDAIKCLYSPDVVEAIFTDNNNPTQRQSYASAKKTAAGEYLVVLAVGGRRNKNVTPVEILHVSENKWNNWIGQGKSIGEMLFENDAEYRSALDVNENIKNRVTAAQFTSKEVIASTPRSPRSNNSIYDSSENSNTKITGLRSRFPDLTEADRQATAQAEREATDERAPALQDTDDSVTRSRYSVAEDAGEIGEAAYDEQRTAQLLANVEALAPKDLRRALTADRAELQTMEKLAKQGGLTADARRTMPELRRRVDAEQSRLKEVERKTREERAAAKERQAKRQTPRRAREDFIRDVMDHFSVREGRGESGEILGRFFDQAREQGRINDADKTELFRKLVDAGTVRVEAESSARAIRGDLAHTRIFVPEDVRGDFGDNYELLRREAFANGIILTSDPRDNQIDVLNMDLADRFPGTFRTDMLDRGMMLQNIVDAAGQGRAENISFMEMLERTSDVEGWSVDEQLDAEMNWLDARIDKALYAAGIEVETRTRSALQLAKERAERREVVQRQAEQKALREQQHKTMNALRWIKKNDFKLPDELKQKVGSEYHTNFDAVLSDIDLIAISAANEMRWSGKHQATWRDLADMYQWAQENDPNFLPSEELKKIWQRVNLAKIGEMDATQLETLYRAAVALRTEYYNRNNVINDELHRTFSEVYRDSSDEILASDGKGRLAPWETKGKTWVGKRANDIAKVLRDMRSPVMQLERIGGMLPDGQWMSMAKQLQAGERAKKGYSVRAHAMLEEFTESHQDWIRRADGQGKDAIWYEIEVPELLELHMGDKPIFGNTVKVYMTPMQKVHLYLESKNYQNLQHMTGGRTFVNKELYEQGKNQEALAQGTTVRLAPETVKRMVSDLTEEEQELANLLERYYNGMAKEEINRVSNPLYGYDKAMTDGYAPIFTDANYNKSTAGIFDVTAEGVGHMKSRQQVGRNPSYNLSAIDAFEKHIDQTSRFVGLAIPVRNMENLLNWNGDGTTMKKTLSQKWGAEGLKYITDLLTELQSPTIKERSAIQIFGDEMVSNYVTAVFGANPGIVFKQAASYPAAAAVLGFGNIPSVRQLTNVDEDLIARYTPELAYRKMGLATPEIAEMKKNPNWMDRNKVLRFAIRGGAIQAMDALTVKNLWPWAENYVRKNFPDLEVGDQAMIDAGLSPFYRKVAEAFNEAVNTTQPMYDTMNRADIMKHDNLLTRTFTMFKTVPLQEFNTLAKYIGEAKRGDKAARRSVSRAIASVLVSTLSLEAVEALNALVKNGLKRYRDDDDELTAESFAKTFGLNIAKDLAGIMIGGSEIFEAITNHFGLGGYSSDFSIIGAEQINEMRDTLSSAAGLLERTIGGAFNVAQNDGSVGDYLRRNRGDLLGGIHDLAVAFGKYAEGLPIENIEKYFGGILAAAWPEARAVIGGAFDTTTKKDLSYIPDKELPGRLGDLLSIRGIETDDGTSAELARLYLSGYKDAVPADTPTEIDDRKLTAYEMQMYDNTYSQTIGKSLDALIESDAYIEADDESRAEMLQSLYTFANETAKLEVDPDYEISSTNAWVNKAMQAEESGVDAVTYIQARAAMKAADAANDDNGTIKQVEAETALRGMDLTDEQRAVLWQLTNTGWKAENNPFAGGPSKMEDAGDYAAAGSTSGTTAAPAAAPAAAQEEAPDPTDRTYLRSLYADLTPPEGMDKVTQTQKYRAIVDAFDSVNDQIAALETEMSDAEIAKIQIGYSRSVTPTMYVASKEAMYAQDDAGDNNNSTSQMEAKYALDGMDLTNDQKAVLWQLANKSWKPYSNPYDTDIGQAVYDELHGAPLQSPVPTEEPQPETPRLASTPYAGLNFQLPTADLPSYN